MRPRGVEACKEACPGNVLRVAREMREELVREGEDDFAPEAVGQAKVFDTSAVL